MIRASREGLLTVSDPYGRVLAERESSAMPGSTLLAKMKVGNRVPTLYTRIGGLFGWMCVFFSGALLLIDRRGADVADHGHVRNSEESKEADPSLLLSEVRILCTCRINSTRCPSTVEGPGN